MHLSVLPWKQHHFQHSIVLYIHCIIYLHGLDRRFSCDMHHISHVVETNIKVCVEWKETLSVTCRCRAADADERQRHAEINTQHQSLHEATLTCSLPPLRLTCIQYESMLFSSLRGKYREHKTLLVGLSVVFTSTNVAILTNSPVKTLIGRYFRFLVYFLVYYFINTGCIDDVRSLT